MQRKDMVTRQTVMALALLKAALDYLSKNPGSQLSAAISTWEPKRSLKREPTWSVTRKVK